VRIAAIGYAALVLAWAVIDPSVAGRLAQGLAVALVLAALATAATHRREPLDEVAALAFVPPEPSTATPTVPPEVIDLVTAIGEARTYVPPLVINRIRDIATGRLDDHHRIDLIDAEIGAPDVVTTQLWSVIDPSVAPADVRVRLTHLGALLDELEEL
jgi:hypothetical protein